MALSSNDAFSHSRGRRRRRGRGRALSEINVTPMVDVMLVLLIVFMVSAPLLTVGVPVELPKTEAGAMEEQSEPLTVSIRADGAVFLGESQTPFVELGVRLQALGAEVRGKPIYVRADGRAPYERVAQVMARLQAAGFTSIGLITDTGPPASRGRVSTDLRPALIGSALVHAGVVLAGLWSWMERPPPPPRPASVPVMLVSAPPGVAPAPEPSEPLSEPEPPSLASAPAEPAPPEPSPPAPTPPTPSPPPPPAARPAQITPARPTPAPPKAVAPTAKPTPARPAPAKPAPPTPPSLDLGALKSRLARNSARNAPAASSPGISEADLQAAQAQLGDRLQKLWRPNCEAEGGSRVNVQVRFTLGADGRVQGEPSVVGGLSGDALTRAAQERAVRAVLAGQPYDWLPAEALGVSYAPRFNAEQACAG